MDRPRCKTLSPKMIEAIHSLIRKSLKFRYLIPAVFLMGVGVTVIESVCTGQVYIPVLSYMAMETDNPEKWLLLLALYNIMFIVPLLGVFAAVYAGTDLSIFRNLAVKHTVTVKILMGMFFILLTVLMFLSFKGVFDV